MTNLKSTRFALLVIPLLAVAAMAGVYKSRTNPMANVPGPQDLIGLDRRISLMEQRFYAVEARLNRIEQQVSYSRTPAPSRETVETESMRGQLQLIERRLAEIECGLVKLDERTLTSAPREQRKSTTLSDPCRLNPGTPLKLSSRP
jgi:hypothetical protein